MSKYNFDSKLLFDLYLAPKILLNDDVIIQSTSKIVKMLPFISKLLMSKFKEGIVKKVNNNTINLQIHLIKLDISSDFIKLIQKPYLFKGGDVGLYQDYNIAKGYGLNLDINDIFKLNQIDFESYFEDFNNEIIDLYHLYFSEISKSNFVIHSSNSIFMMKNKEKYQKQLLQFVIDFGTNINDLSYIINLDVINKHNNIFIDIILKLLDNKVSILNIIEITNIVDSLGKNREKIKKKIKNKVYTILNNIQFKNNIDIFPELIDIIIELYPTMLKTEPDITNFILKVLLLKQSKSMNEKLFRLFTSFTHTYTRSKLSILDIKNIIIGIIDTINITIDWKKFKIDENSISYANLEFSLTSSFRYLYDNKNDLNFLLKMKGFILNLYSVISISDDWVDYLIDSLNAAEIKEDEENMFLIEYVKTYLANDIVKMATKIKHPNLKEIKRVFNDPNEY